MRAVFEVMGVTNILAKCFGSTNPYNVVRATLTALGKSRAKGAIGAIASMLSSESDWPIRVRAAEALGAIAAGSRNARAVKELSAAAEQDEYALVREAAVKALARVDPQAARPVLLRAADRDSEPRVRKAAKAELGGSR